ncbi:MAG: 2-hydroxyglutaryl-CoA dehydratase, partial [Clostridia bacterium]|nr:2-hydroxyglutaryl-CoA dehydratase [Clostridia bacterium]
MKRIGLDIGSTTIKCIVMDEEGNILFDSYRRHFSKISENAGRTLNEIADNFPNEEMLLSVSGSAGMGIATDLNLPFAQEVYATRTAVNRRLPGTDVVI